MDSRHNQCHPGCASTYRRVQPPPPPRHYPTVVSAARESAPPALLLPASTLPALLLPVSTFQLTASHGDVGLHLTRRLMVLSRRGPGATSSAPLQYLPTVSARHTLLCLHPAVLRCPDLLLSVVRCAMLCVARINCCYYTALHAALTWTALFITKLCQYCSCAVLCCGRCAESLRFECRCSAGCQHQARSDL